MTTQLITTKPENSIFSVLELMLKHRLSGIPVVSDEGELVGFAPNTKIMETVLPDFLRTLPPSVAGIYGANLKQYLQDKKEDLMKLTVKDIMVKPIYVLQEDSTFIEAAKAFVEKGISRISVLNKENKLVGIISRNTVLTALRDSLI